MKKLVIAFLAMVAFLIAIGIAGRFDRDEVIIQSIPLEEYLAIKAQLGGNCSEHEIAEYYINNKQK